VISSYVVPDNNLTIPRRAREKSRDRRRDPLGLSIVYDPGTSRRVDIIFVHGLGGTSRQTWSKNRDPDLFWPGRWLPSDEGFSAARILSFGYNAYFMSSGPASNANVLDFSKELLFDMRFGKDENGEELEIGKVGQCVLMSEHSLMVNVLGSSYFRCSLDGGLGGEKSAFIISKPELSKQICTGIYPRKSRP
jgi:hypothetical protein